jgi:hypothetical protein
MNLSFKFDEAVPQNTMCYACVISDRMFKFTPDGRIITPESY